MLETGIPFVNNNTNEKWRPPSKLTNNQTSAQTTYPSCIFSEVQKSKNALPQAKLPTGVQDATRLRGMDYSLLGDVDFTNLEDGKQYYIKGYHLETRESGKEVFIPEVRDIEKSTHSNKFNFSEGLDRQITEIRVSASLDKKVQRELIEIGKQKGFTVTVLENKANSLWVEDYSNFRSDGKVAISFDDGRVKGVISESRRSMNVKGRPLLQGAVAENKLASDYEQLMHPGDIVKGRTYLEGGNVLTTYTKDGKPAAIIGEESLMVTKAAITTKDNQNVSDRDVIELMAQDLGVEPENITIIPQFDFHIDMSYRPLKNGQIAVPDFETAISILETTKLDGVNDKVQELLLDKLRNAAEQTKEIREDAKSKLEQSGYSIVNIPCFSVLYDRMTSQNPNKANYMNAVCGTAPDGSTYYITNKSDYPAIDDIIVKYFKEAGIEDVFFVSTNTYLHKEGGIDCLTKEIAQNIK